mgnify:FL=1
MEWLFGKRGNAAVDTECGLLRKQNESVTTGNQKSNCMEYETTIESENCFLVCDKNNRNNYTRVVKINVPTF